MTLRTNKLAWSLLQSSKGLNRSSSNPSKGNLLSRAKKSFSRGLSTVKSLLAEANRFHVVDALEALIEGRKESSSSVSDFKPFDPKLPPGRNLVLGPIASKDVVVFIVGGGNYLEQESLELWSASHAKIKQVVYGTTEMLSAEKVMVQLKDLAKKTSQ